MVELISVRSEGRTEFIISKLMGKSAIYDMVSTLSKQTLFPSANISRSAEPSVILLGLKMASQKC